MKKEHISDALNMLNDDIIEETNNVRTNAKPKRKWVKWGAVAACLCCAIAVIWSATKFSITTTTPMPDDGAVEEAHGFTLDTDKNVMYFPIPFADRIRYGIIEADEIGLTPENTYRITRNDIGEYMGVVGTCEEANLIGCPVYHFTKFPNYDSICIVETETGYAFYTAERLNTPDEIGQLSDVVLGTYGIPDSVEKVEVSNGDDLLLFEVEDKTTISRIIEILSGKENIGHEANARRLAEAWYDAYGNKDVYFSEEDGHCVFKRTNVKKDISTYVDDEGNTITIDGSASNDWSIQDKAYSLWNKGERLIRITTNKGFVLTVDYFPAVKTIIFGNGYYVLPENETQELNILLSINE